MGSTPNFVYGQVPTAQQWGNAFSAKLDDLPAQYASPGTGATLTAAQGQGAWVLSPSGEIANLTVVLPVGTIEGQRFTVTSTQTIDNLVVNAAGAQTVTGGAVGVLGGNGGVEWRFRLDTTTWNRWR